MEAGNVLGQLPGSGERHVGGLQAGGVGGGQTSFSHLDITRFLSSTPYFCLLCVREGG